MENFTEYNSTEGITFAQQTDFDTSVKLLIGIYCTIFVLGVVGNILVILTLVQNTRMRTVTNVFLLNLAISDLLLAVFCMPFTLVPIFIRNFVFGAFICVSIRYAQGELKNIHVSATFKTALKHYGMKKSFKNPKNLSWWTKFIYYSRLFKLHCGHSRTISKNYHVTIGVLLDKYL